MLCYSFEIWTGLVVGIRKVEDWQDLPAFFNEKDRESVVDVFEVGPFWDP